jgi:hypothetical protein
VTFLDHTKLNTHIHTVGHLRESNKLVAEAATYITHNKHKRRTSFLSAALELAMPATKWLQISALYRTVTVIGVVYIFG